MRRKFKPKIKGTKRDRDPPVPYDPPEKIALHLPHNRPFKRALRLRKGLKVEKAERHGVRLKVKRNYTVHFYTYDILQWISIFSSKPCYLKQANDA